MNPERKRDVVVDTVSSEIARRLEARSKSEREMLPLTLSIPLRPMAAVRMTHRSKYVSLRAKAYLAWKEAVGLAMLSAMRGAPPFEGLLGVHLEFAWQPRTPKDTPGDLSNLVKSCEDAGNRIVWVDDKNIRCIVATMHAAREDVIRLVVERLEG